MAQNHFPQLGISPAACCPTLSLPFSLCLSLGVWQIETLDSQSLHGSQPSRFHCVAATAACATYAVHSFMNAFYMAISRRGGSGLVSSRVGEGGNLTAFTVTRVIIS